ncbi:MAG: lytic transglycosylase domain-containing protein [Acidobacteriota bacterium]|nr:lytic transglycosylase domain-containing protein [Acidobacteriota bacterium]
MRMRFKVFRFGLALLAAVCPLAHAAEHVTLKNGFELDCTHREIVGDKVRLYLAGNNFGTASGNYMDVGSEAVLRIETIPDPPPPASALTLTKAASGTPLTPDEMHEMLASAGAAHHIDEDLLASVIRAESGGQASAVSHTGAQGLMQLMPATARDLGVANAFQPDQNIAGGTAYLDALLTRYHDNATLAIAAYNAGPATVDRYHGVPPYRETRGYVARVIREFNRRKRASLIAQAR